MMLRKESNIAIPLTIACIAGYGTHSIIDKLNENNCHYPQESPAHVVLDENTFGQSTLPKLPQKDSLIEEKNFFAHELKSNIAKIDERLQELETKNKDLQNTPFTNEQLHQISEYIEQEKNDLILKLLKSSVSIITYTPDEFDDKEEIKGYGAGTVIRHPSGDCYILTCAHLFQKITKTNFKSFNDIVIRDFQGNILRPIKVISCDQYDIAVVKIANLSDAVPVEKIGEYCLGNEILGFGQPYGYKSIYDGIVSSTKKNYLKLLNDGNVELREADEIEDDFLMEHIQYSAPVDPGHSGGSLLNQNGEFIGMAASVREGSRGISFFIPSKLAVSIGNQLYSDEKCTTADLGILVQELTSQQKTILSNSHVLDNYLEEKCSFIPALRIISLNSSARKAGLEVGDVIIRINEYIISSKIDYLKALQFNQNDDEFSLDVLRDDTIIRLDLKESSRQTIKTRVIE